MAKSSAPTDSADRPLTDKQRRFVQEYLVDFNGTRAAKAAGYSDKDNAVGHRTLKLPHVQKAVCKACLEAQVRLEVNGDHIRWGFAAIAFDPREVSNGGPSYMERMAALDRLAKLFGLYRDQAPQTGLSLEQLLKAAAEREALLPAAPIPLRLLQGGKT